MVFGALAILRLLGEIVRAVTDLRRVSLLEVALRIFLAVLLLVWLLAALAWDSGYLSGMVLTAYSLGLGGIIGVILLIGRVTNQRRARKAAELYEMEDLLARLAGGQPQSREEQYAAEIELAFRPIADQVYAAIDGERRQLGLPKLIRNTILGQNALKLLQEADSKSDFDALNADYRRRTQNTGYPSLFREALAVRALLYQKSWEPTPPRPVQELAAEIAGGILAWARDNRRNHDTEELYWPNSFGALLDEAAQDVSMGMVPAIPDPLPGIIIMLGVGAADYSSAIINRINQARATAGVAPLGLDAALREIVRNYLAREEFWLPGQLGQDLLKYGYAEQGVILGAAMHGGVNPLQLPYNADTELVHIEEIVATLTASLLKDYRDRLLSPDFQDIGVAVMAGRSPEGDTPLADCFWAKAEFVVGYRTAGPNFPR